MAGGAGKPGPRNNQKFFRGRLFHRSAFVHPTIWNFSDEYFSVDRFAVVADYKNFRASTFICERRRWNCIVCSCGVVVRRKSVATLWIDASHWRADFHVDADAFGDDYFVARRYCLARDVLSAGGSTARNGLKVLD